MSVKITDNSKEFEKEFEAAMLRAAEQIGLTAVDHAQMTIDKAGAIDTARLINSITFALSGKEANNATYQDNNENTFTYDGKAPDTGKYDVYVGTNVEYALGIETGDHRKAGGVHFIRDAASEHTEEYKDIILDELKG